MKAGQSRVKTPAQSVSDGFSRSQHLCFSDILLWSDWTSVRILLRVLLTPQERKAKSRCRWARLDSTSVNIHSITPEKSYSQRRVNTVLAKKELLHLKVQQPPLVATESKNVEVLFWWDSYGLSDWLLGWSSHFIGWRMMRLELPQSGCLFERLLDWHCILLPLCLHNQTCLLMTLRPRQSSSHLLVVLHQPSKSSSIERLHFLQLILNSTLLFLQRLKVTVIFLCWQSDMKDTKDVQRVVPWTWLWRHVSMMSRADSQLRFHSWKQSVGVKVNMKVNTQPASSPLLLFC